MRHLLSYICFVILFVFMFQTEGVIAQQKRIPEKTYFPIVPSPYQRDNPLSVIRNDFTITLRDGVILDATKFYPSEPNPYWPNGYPEIIMCHGYGGSKEEMNGFASAQSTYGYVVYTYSMRGQGNSGGLSNLISRTEALDLIEFLNYVKHDNTTGGDSSNIMVQGGSQGGIIPLMAASMGMKTKAIITSVATPDFASSWIENNSIKMTFLWTIEYTPDIARYNPTVDRMSNWVYQSDQKAKWDSLAYYLPRDRDFTNIISQNTNPVMMENSWQDKFFNAAGTLNAIPNFTTQNRYYFGAVLGHGGDYSNAENIWHENFWNEFYFYWIWGINNNILTRPKFHYASTTFPVQNAMWSFKHDSSYVWPPAGASEMKLFFSENNKLAAAPDTNQNSFVTLNNKVISGFTLMDAVYEEFAGTYFTSNFKKANITFESAPLTANVRMTGNPKINLDYSSNVNLGQFNFQIYEVSPSRTRFVNRVNYTDRNMTVNQRKTSSFDGQSHSHIFKAGSKIRIVVTNLDKIANDPFLGTNPFVLPVMKNGKHKLFLSNNSYISFPVIPAGSDNPGLKTVESGNENAFRLEQNFPNPFNPVTNIRFRIQPGYSGPVTLKIYDISGRETATLISQVMKSGYYEASWDAAKYSSGVYFYKLVAGNNIEVKRMILIK